MKYLALIFCLLGMIGCSGLGFDCDDLPLTIWPPLGKSQEAVAYIEERTCDFIVFYETDFPDIRVGYDDRGCLQNCALPGVIYISHPDCSTYESFGTKLAVHEIMHVLGHWHHDVYSGKGAHSIMEPIVHRNSIIFNEDIEWLIDNYCFCP